MEQNSMKLPASRSSSLYLCGIYFDRFISE